MKKCPSFKECHVRSGRDSQCSWFPEGYCTFPHPASKSSHKTKITITSRIKESFRSTVKRGWKSPTADYKEYLFFGV